MASDSDQESVQRKAHIKEVARNIAAQFDFATVMESREMLVSDRGVFREGIAEAVIKREVEAIEPEESNQFSKEVIGHIERSSYVRLKEFDSDLNRINIENGLYLLDSGTLEDHNVGYLSRVQLPVRLDRKAAPVAIMRFLKEVLPNEDDVLNVLEDAAATLIRDARFQKAFMYIGAGDNGKSTWLNVLGAFLGATNVSNTSIHDLASNRFAAGNIEGKLANIYPDIEADEVSLTGKVKAIVAGDPIDVEKKGLQAHRIVPFAKLFFSANTLPIVNDDSDAWFRRWRITNWLYRVDPAKRDPDLLAKLTTSQELSGLFNVLAALARRLIKQWGFTYNATIPQVRAEWGDKASVIKAFKSKYLNVQGDPLHELAATSADVYAAYVKFCLSQNFTPKKQTGFMEELKTVVVVRSENARVGGRVIKVLKGIELKEFPGLGSLGTPEGTT